MGADQRRHNVENLLADGKLLIGDGYRAKNDELTTSGIPFARAGNINDGFRFQDADYFPHERLDRVGNKISEPGDVVFTSKGSVGRFALVRPSTQRFVYSPQLCFWRSMDRDVIDPRFLYYWMFGREFYLQYKGVAGQTDMAEYVSLTDQRRMHITLPSAKSQRAIAHILGSLDDKIELNRRMNDTLEAMARALFKSWFVDFDPVRAKAEGRQPSGMDAETAKLFPSEFVESELGRIPKGWRVGTIGDLIAIHDAKRIPLSAREREQRRGRYPYHGATSVMDHIDGFLFDGTFVLVGEDGSVVTEAGLPFTQYVWGQFWVNNHAHVLSGLGGMSQEHLFLLLSQTNITAFVTGAVQAKLSQGNLRRIPTVVPPPAVSVRFGSAHADLFARFRSNVEETRTLARARDELLPRLLSGELSVANAASAMEAIA